MSDSEDYSDFEESFAAAASASKGKKGKKGDKNVSIERIYQKKTQLEHILLRPDTYIGSVEKETKQMWVWDEDENSGKMVSRDISYVPGLYKIFDEILVNAADNKQRDKNMNCIRIDIDVEENEITIYNNGKGIPVVEHKEEKVYVPTLIFGHLLTSSNYNDEEKKVVGGRNGYGAKLCNIFSKKFKVETSSKEYRKAFTQSWTENMKNAKDARIVASSGEDFTRITFQPDLEKFGMSGLDADIVALFSRRAFDVAGSTKGVKVYLNGKRLPISGFKDYVELFVKDREDEVGNPIKVAYEVVNDRWEIAATVSDRGFQQVSFVNSIATTRGGKHVDYVADQIVSKVADIIKKKNKAGVAVKPFQIKNHLWIFVNCLIENPSFDSQTKETMTLQAKSFGSKCTPNDKFFNTVIKVGVVEAILTWVKFKAQTELSKKCHAKKQSKLSGVPKLEDANDAGTKNSIDCTLILTEGDSAKSLVVGGLGVVGRDKYGVFPLKGKILNVREASHKQILENAEINNIIKILGLQYKKKYESVDDLKTLRYGKVMIMTDQDQDGSHIKGLLINFIHHNWPSLLKLNFLEEFITPIVKASKGSEVHSFYSLPEFEEWKKVTPNWKNYKVKYYKGLGTSTSAEAKEYFSDMQRHRIRFSYTGQEDDHFVQLAFSKKMIEQRKDWLTNSMEDRKRRRELGLAEVYLYEKTTRNVSFKDFVNKELVLFSNMDNERSIPSLIDGLKPGQRKVLYTCFKRNDKREVKVAQLAGSVGEHSAYHHGEASLMSTIINLAQNFVGSNNINLLQPIGQFGTRLQGGKDAASPRYIFTMLSPLARKIFSPLDDPLYNYLFDDNLKIEPEYYVPILPMVLVNGAEGIGTGWSTKIPNYNPRVIIDNLLRMIRGQELRPMRPWFKGFQGTIEQIDHQRFVINGEAALLGSKSFEITELPVRVWTQTYKEQVLEPMLNGSEKTPAFITDYKEYHTDTTVKFVVTLSEDNLHKSMHTGLHKMFKIQSSLSTTSMVLFDHNGCLRRYETPEDIFREFFPVRLEYYGKRKAYYEGILEAEALKLENQARFIMEKNDRILIMENVKRKEFIAQLIKRNYDSDPIKAWKAKNVDKLDDYSSESEDEAGDEDRKYNFDYLIDMSMRSMLREKVEELLKLRNQKKDELNKLRNSTPEDLWQADLQELLEELDRVEAAEKEAMSLNGLGKGKLLKTSKTSARPIKSMKSISAEDFLPSVDGERVEPKIDSDLLKKTTTGAAKKALATLDKAIDKENGVVDNDNTSTSNSVSNGIASTKPASLNDDSDSDMETAYVPLSQRVGISPDLLDKGVSRLNKPTSDGLVTNGTTNAPAKEKKAPAKKRVTKPKDNGTKKNGGKAGEKGGKKKKKKEEWETSSGEDKSSSESEKFIDSEDDEDMMMPSTPKPKAKPKPKPTVVKKEKEEQFGNGSASPRRVVDSDDELFATKPQEKTKTSEELFDSIFTPTKATSNGGGTSSNNDDLEATVVSNGNDTDEDFLAKPKKTTNNNNKKKATKKAAASSDDDFSDFDDFKPKAKAPAKPKKAKVKENDESSKPKKQAKPKKKKKASSESDDEEVVPKKKSKAIAKAMDDTLNEIPPEFRTKTGRIRQPVSYNFGGSSDDD